jgi:hypothetical protein
MFARSAFSTSSSVARFGAVVAACLLAVAAASVQAQERHGGGGGPKFNHPLPPGPPAHAPARPGQWFDGAHGHRHYYPVSGWRVAAPPPHAHWVPWGGVRYGYWSGVWYAPYGSAWVVARPPIGVVVTDLPEFRSVVMLGGITYLYANGIYYREHVGGGYEVVPSPVVAAGDASAGRMYVYPKQGQTAEKQASDEYECHRWAVNQTGFDPSAAAAGQGTGPTARSDYGRAQNACLEGRGYTVR